MFDKKWQFAVLFAKIYKQNIPSYKARAKRIKVQLCCKEPETKAEISRDDCVMRFPDNSVINKSNKREKCVI